MVWYSHLFQNFPQFILIHTDEKSENEWKSLSRVQLFVTPMECRWNSPGQNTGVGSCSLLQGIFPTQWSNSGLPHCRQILYQLSHQGSPGVFPQKHVSSSKVYFLKILSAKTTAERILFPLHALMFVLWHFFCEPHDGCYRLINPCAPTNNTSIPIAS